MPFSPAVDITDTAPGAVPRAAAGDEAGSRPFRHAKLTASRLRRPLATLAVTLGLVDEPVYRDFREYARQHDRTASEIIREAMEDFRSRKIRRPTSLMDIRPVSVGRVLQPFKGSEDMLEELSRGQSD